MRTRSEGRYEQVIILFMDFRLKIKPRLLLFDLDGTLLDSKKQISQRNMKAIAECRKKGILIGVATARSEPTCQPFADAIQPDLLISNSGALVRLRGTVIYQCGFTAEETSILVGAGVAEQRGITVDCEDVTYSNRHIPFYNMPGMVYTAYGDFRRRSFKICIEGSDTPFAEKTASLVSDCCWLTFSDCDWFKFSKCNVSKGNALHHVADKTGIKTEEMMSFGDDYVDIEMLELCGTGIAMSNAAEKVKAHADAVIGDNNSDAIADFLYSNIIRNQ